MNNNNNNINEIDGNKATDKAESDERANMIFELKANSIGNYGRRHGWHWLKL